MLNKDNVIRLKKPDLFADDPIADILRQGARKLLTQALEAEIEILVHQYKDRVDELGSHPEVCPFASFKYPVLSEYLNSYLPKWRWSSIGTLIRKQ